MLVLAKLARLAGVDSLHTGTVVGKMDGVSREVLEINKFLLGDWFGLKPVLPVASGGLYPGLIHDLMQKTPITDANKIVSISGLTLPTVNSSIKHLIDLGIATELTGRARNKTVAAGFAARILVFRNN